MSSSASSKSKSTSLFQLGRTELKDQRAGFNSSVHFQDINQMMGIDFANNMEEMKTYATLHALEYNKMRIGARKMLLDNVNQFIYLMFWNILKKGEIQDISNQKDTFQLQTDVPWSPDMPDNLIDRQATAACEAVSSITENLLNSILPSSFDKVANAVITSTGSSIIKSAAVNNNFDAVGDGI